MGRKKTYKMKLFGAMILGLATAGTVEFGSDEEKFMKREVDYCAAQRLSRQECATRMKTRMEFNFEMSFTCAMTDTDTNQHENHKSQRFEVHQSGWRALCDYQKRSPSKSKADQACTQANSMCANDSYKQKCVMNYFKIYVDGACDARLGANYNMLVTDKQHKPGTEGNAVTSSGTYCYCSVFCH